MDALLFIMQSMVCGHVPHMCTRELDDKESYCVCFLAERHKKKKKKTDEKLTSVHCTGQATAIHFSHSWTKYIFIYWLF